MESIIEELYYGNITPAERSFRRTGEYAHILQLVTRNEEKLTERDRRKHRSPRDYIEKCSRSECRGDETDRRDRQGVMYLLLYP